MADENNKKEEQGEQNNSAEELNIEQKDEESRSEKEEILTPKKSFFSKECKKCEEVKKECEEYKSGWQRALADYKNLQREISERRSEWMQMSEQQILEEFIPVYDHLKMAVVGVGDSGPWLEGVKHVLRQFSEILKNHGVEEIKTVGEKFDPILHEAVGEEDGDVESGKIVKEVSAGYTMGSRTIKAAKVIIKK